MLNAQQNNSSQKIKTFTTATFKTYILTLNKFIFDCRNYQQVEGCAMGTKKYQDAQKFLKDN